jgi:hypothetical protein
MRRRTLQSGTLIQPRAIPRSPHRYFKLPVTRRLAIPAPVQRYFPSRSLPMPKAYAVVTYRSISDPEKLAAYRSSRSRQSHLLGRVSLLAAMRQSP